MPAIPETVIVPWFSRKEWYEVYCGAYSDNVDMWKEARDTMLVWQARVNRLPTGVDLTLPLLQAKITDADPYMDADVKYVMQATAIHRFVSSVVKLPQAKYYHSQTLHTLAANIGLPGHLVDLRNEIIHGESGWAGGCTITEALETSFRWIKHYYWIPELKQMKTKEDQMSDKPALHQKLLVKAVNSYVKSVMEGVEIHYMTEVLAVTLKRFNEYYFNNPEDCMESVVRHLLAAPGLQKNLEKKLKCGCFSDETVIKHLENVLSKILMNEGVADLLLHHLINQVRENKAVFMVWINLVIRSLIRLSEMKENQKYCSLHFLSLKRNNSVNWKKVVSNLLQIEEEWATDLALSVMNSPQASFEKEEMDKIMELLSLTSCSSKEENTKKKKSSELKITESDLFDVNSVLEQVNKSNSEVSGELDAVKIDSSRICMQSPLGILPHQVGNRSLYKELLLHYPKDKDMEPPVKRMKTQNNTA